MAHESPALPVESDEVWTFGFGSNMNIKLLEAKKGHRVLEAVPGLVRGWRLSFATPALALVEPAFADARPGGADDELHGVAVRMPAADYARLRKQEASYDEAAVVVEAYAPRGRLVHARLFTMRSAPPAGAPDIPCSARYLRVLVDGARAAGLDAAYVERLAARPVYAPSAATLARRAAALAVPPAALPAVTVAALAEGYAPPPLGAAAPDAPLARVAVAGYVVELPRARVPFGSHRGRDVTARARRQWRGEPLDEGDDLGRPPFAPLDDAPPEEAEFVLQYLDTYLERGEVVGFVSEFREMLEARAAERAAAAPAPAPAAAAAAAGNEDEGEGDAEDDERADEAGGEGGLAGGGGGGDDGALAGGGSGGVGAGAPKTELPTFVNPLAARRGPAAAAGGTPAERKAEFFAALKKQAAEEAEAAAAAERRRRLFLTPQEKLADAEARAEAEAAEARKARKTVEGLKQYGGAAAAPPGR